MTDPNRSEPSPAPVFESVLTLPGAGGGAPADSDADALSDLNLDQLMSSITAGRDEYELDAFFVTPLHNVEAVRYRQAALRDLRDAPVLDAVRAFAEGMRTVRRRLGQADKLHYPRQQRRWRLDAGDAYCDAVRRLAAAIADLDLDSDAFRDLRSYVEAYVSSADFETLAADTASVRRALAAVRYDLRIKGLEIRVTPFDGEVDYGAEVERTFAKFQQDAAREHKFSFRSFPDMNHVEAAALDMVAAQFPDAFGSLDGWVRAHADFGDATLLRFDREVQFYLAYLEYLEPLEAAGLPFCFPEVLEPSTKEVEATESFDLPLARSLLNKGMSVVRNDLALRGRERILVVSGPNQGGKTTFARMFGQLHWLASLGLLVPGRRARLAHFDRLFTHFERQEEVENLTSKLEDDLLRIRSILHDATGASIVVLNESFSATTVSDALFLSTNVLRQAIECDLRAVFVTFLDELTTLDPSIVSMVSTVDPVDPAKRTFRVVRRPADGRAYALAIAEKHGLTYEMLSRRLER